MEGRGTILQEIAAGPEDLRAYLGVAVKALLAESRFLDVLPGFVVDDGRVLLVQERLAGIAGNRSQISE